ncbi:hypothetical protein ABT187_43300 [Streptomyces sp. NPDC001817]|uniref:hypothetical protein n=1 Tax=Streptomyces sp. NPDC001817 TaxID=3154398 RepID=UPI00331C2F2A
MTCGDNYQDYFGHTYKGRWHYVPTSNASFEGLDNPISRKMMELVFDVTLTFHPDQNGGPAVDVALTKVMPDDTEQVLGTQTVGYNLNGNREVCFSFEYAPPVSTGGDSADPSSVGWGNAVKNQVSGATTTFRQAFALEPQDCDGSVPGLLVTKLARTAGPLERYGEFQLADG